MQVTQACWLSDRSGTDTYADHVGVAILASHFEYMPDGTDTQKTIVLPVATLLGQWQTIVLHTFFSHLLYSFLISLPLSFLFIGTQTDVQLRAQTVPRCISCDAQNVIKTQWKQNNTNEFLSPSYWDM